MCALLLAGQGAADCGAALVRLGKPLERRPQHGLSARGHMHALHTAWHALLQSCRQQGGPPAPLEVGSGAHVQTLVRTPAVNTGAPGRPRRGAHAWAGGVPSGARA